MDNVIINLYFSTSFVFSLVLSQGMNSRERVGVEERGDISE